MLNTCFTSLLAVSGENLALGGRVVLIGIGTVFSVLILLWLCLELLHFLLNLRKEKTTASETVTLPAPEAAAVPAVTEDDEDEFAAVIAAAVYAAQADAPHSTFRAVSFKRIH